MMKVLCEKCNKVNKISKNIDFYYCSYCGHKGKVEIINQKKSYLKIFLIMFLIIFIILGIILVPIRQYSNKIYASEMKKTCRSAESCVLNNIMKKKIFSIFKFKIVDKITYINLDSKYSVTIKQFGKNKKFDFTIVDDLGPDIITDEVYFAYLGEIEYDNQIKISDYIDGDININSDKVSIDVSKVNIKEEGVYSIDVEAIDKSNNKTNKTIKAIVEKQKPKNIIINDNQDYYINNEIVLNATVEPDNTFDKNVVWLVDDNKIGENKFTPNKVGQIKICAESVMDSSINSCTFFSIKNICQNKYVFNLSGGNSYTYSVGDTGDICPGTYTITASVVNSSTLANVAVTYPGSYGTDFDLITPNFRGYGGNGDKYVLTDGTNLEADSGITKIVLIKK